MQQIASIPFQIPCIGKEWFSHAFTVAARAFWVWVAVVDKPNTSRCIRRMRAVSLSFTLSGKLLGNIPPLIFVLVPPAVPAVNASILSYFVRVRVDDCSQLTDHIIEFCSVSFLALISYGVNIAPNLYISVYLTGSKVSVLAVAFVPSQTICIYSCFPINDVLCKYHLLFGKPEIIWR